MSVRVEYTLGANTMRYCHKCKKAPIVMELQGAWVAECATPNCQRVEGPTLWEILKLWNKDATHKT